MNIITKYNAYLKLFGLTKIPLLLFVNPTIVSMNDEEVELKIPLNFRTKNHLNSLYFGSLAVGADTAGGLLATKFIHESKQKVHLSFKDFRAEFIRRAEGDTYFSNRQGKEIKAMVDEVIANPGLRKNLTLQIEAHTKLKSQAVRELVAKFDITLSLKLKS